MKTASEARFETYLVEHGYEFSHEPDLGVTKRPDYLVIRDEHRAICEVKEFATTAIRDRLEKMGGTAALGPKLVFGTVRAQIDAAARQLKPLACSGVPLVVVLANPHGADVNLGAEHVVYALYGNPAVTFAVNPETGEMAEGLSGFADRDGALTAKHSYVSAVITVHERSLEQDWLDDAARRHPGSAVEFLRFARDARERGEIPDGSRRWIHVFHTAAAARGEAVALPETFFDGPGDLAWAFKDGAYVQTRGQVSRYQED